MLLFPNPANGSVKVSWGVLADGQIRIIGVDGRELRRMEYTHADCIEFATEGLPKGCCTVMRCNKDGMVLVTEKLIIK